MSYTRLPTLKGTKDLNIFSRLSTITKTENICLLPFVNQNLFFSHKPISTLSQTSSQYEGSRSISHSPVKNTWLTGRMSSYILFRHKSSISGKYQNHYEVLGLHKSATNEDIRDAFLKRSKESHPDLNRSDPDNHQIFVQVNEAYSILSKPELRRHYDSVLNDNPLGPSTSAQNDVYYHHPKYSREEWLRHHGLREEYFRQNSSGHHQSGTGGKISNIHIVTFCMLFMSVGIVLHLLVVKQSSDRHLQNLNDRDLRTHEIWMKAKQASKDFTPRELLTQHINKQETKSSTIVERID